MYDRSRWPMLLALAAFALLVLSWGTLLAAETLLDETKRLVPGPESDAVATLLAFDLAMVTFSRFMMYVTGALLLLAAATSFANRKWPPSGASLDASVDDIRAAVARITATATEVGDIEVKRAKMAAQRADLDALLSTTEDQRRAVLKHSGTKKWTLISIGVGAVITLALFGYSEFLADKL